MKDDRVAGMNLRVSVQACTCFGSILDRIKIC